MDDYLGSFQSQHDAVATVNDVRLIHKIAEFDLHKIVSNSEHVMNAFQVSIVSSVDVSADKSERVLGMYWRPTTDEFIFHLKYHRVPEDIIQL